MTNFPRVHFSFPVDDIEGARRFYGATLGCVEGRQVPGRVDFNFFGHHLVGHLAPSQVNREDEPKVGDTGETPLRHFGLILELDEFEVVRAKLQDARWPFLVEPKTTSPGTVREHRVAVVRDGCGNTLEFKGFQDIENIFEN